jgi:hypothetical protein
MGENKITEWGKKKEEEDIKGTERGGRKGAKKKRQINTNRV